MKTIYTSLPIYDRLSKQCFERGKHGGFDTPVPIICPRYRLPSFQWNAEADNMGAISKIQLIDFKGDDYHAFPFGDWVTHSFFTTFTHVGLEITEAARIANATNCISSTRKVKEGETIKIIGNLNRLSGDDGNVIACKIYAGTGEVQSTNLSNGINTITYTFTAGDEASGLGSVAIYTFIGSTCHYSFTGVSIDIDSFNQYFVTLPASHVVGADTYYTYNGDTLNYLLPEGTFYLKITTANGYVLYSEWFKSTCVYENLITSWINDSYAGSWSSSGTKIINAVWQAGGSNEWSSVFSIKKGETITLMTFLTVTGQVPSVAIYYGYVAGVTLGTLMSNTVALAAGLNIVTLTATVDATNAYIRLSNSAAATISLSDVLVKRDYSTKYLTINYSNGCDLGDILYHEGLTQTIWFESETMENTYPQDEEGVKNGEQQFVRTFARQLKKYLARTMEMPDFMVEVFHRMKLHDSIELIDLVGNVNDVYNLEVEHDWLGDDKYYAKIDLTFDYNEAFVIGGCCNNFS